MVRIRALEAKLPIMMSVSAGLAIGGMLSSMILPPRYTMVIGCLPLTLVGILSFAITFYRSGFCLELALGMEMLTLGMLVIGIALSTNGEPLHSIGRSLALVGGGFLLITLAIVALAGIRIVLRRRRKPPP